MSKAKDPDKPVRAHGRKREKRGRAERIEEVVECFKVAYRAAGVTGPTLDGVADQVRSQLQNKSSDQICRIYDDIKELVEENLSEEEISGSELYFHQPRAAADFEYWSKMPGWSLEEAVALSLGKAPEVVNRVTMDVIFQRWPPFATKYERLHALVSRANELGQLSDPVLPGDFLAWAKKNEINVSAELVEKVEAQGIVIADWEAQFEALKTQCDEERTAKDNRIVELTLELDALHEQIREMKARLASDVPLRESERGSLLKIIFGMAIASYDYKPDALRNTATGENEGSVHADLVRLGLDLDVDTDWRYIKEAESQFGDCPKSAENLAT
jgi:hypothetical protein